MIPPPEPSASRAWFTTTRWSIVLQAGQAHHNPQAHAALEQLCQTYWYPLYAFARRQGHSPHDAEDLVQGFLAECLAKNRLATADPDRGRFRSFLLLAFKRYQGRTREKATAQKRGHGQTLSLDAVDAEHRYTLEPAHHLTADRLYDRRWALTLLDRVLAQLEAEQSAAGRAPAFHILKQALAQRGGESGLADLARQLDLSLGAVKVAVHRLRRRYRELLEAEIAQTVASPDHIAEERRHLLAALASPSE